MSYRQLTPEQRYQIGACLKIGMKRSEIAKEIKVHRSTVWREIKRNSTPYRYNPSRAIRVAMGRHKAKLKKQIDHETWTKVEKLLGFEWSPEQISERLKLEGCGHVSHETIYLHIYRNKAEGGDLYKHLRRRHTYRKRIHKYYKRFGWDARRPISERPAIVETRSRLGDWEADTIIGRERRDTVTGGEAVALLPASKGPDQIGDHRCRSHLRETPPPRRQGPYHHLRQWPRVQAPPENRSRSKCRLLLCRPILILAARHRREHQRPRPTIHPQTISLRLPV